MGDHANLGKVHAAGPAPVWRRLLWMLLCGWVMAPPALAQDAAITDGPQPIVGANQKAAGDEVVIYYVKIIDSAAFPLTGEPNLGQQAGANPGIQIILSDLTTPTGMLASDITELRLYRSNDAILDGSDGAPLATQGVVVINPGGGPFVATQIDVVAAIPGTGLPRQVDGAGAYFLISAVISNTAVSGHAFRTSVAANHIGIYEPGIFGAGDYTRGNAVAAADGNYVVIGSQTPAFTGDSRPAGGTIPFGGETAIMLLLIGTGLYALRGRPR